jgi:hypothetical protein
VKTIMKAGKKGWIWFVLGVMTISALVATYLHINRPMVGRWSTPSSFTAFNNRNIGPTNWVSQSLDIPGTDYQCVIGPVHGPYDPRRSAHDQPAPIYYLIEVDKALSDGSSLVLARVPMSLGYLGDVAINRKVEEVVSFDAATGRIIFDSGEKEFSIAVKDL